MWLDDLPPLPVTPPDPEQISPIYATGGNGSCVETIDDVIDLTDDVIGMTDDVIGMSDDGFLDSHYHLRRSIDANGDIVVFNPKV